MINYLILILMGTEHYEYRVNHRQPYYRFYRFSFLHIYIFCVCFDEFDIEKFTHNCREVH